MPRSVTIKKPSPVASGALTGTIAP